MNDTSRNPRGRILTFAALVELGTGLALAIDPAIVVTLLMGADADATARVVGRCFGIALLALGLACWPRRHRCDTGSPAFRAMMTYNALIALYLAYLGTVEDLRGLLLWPAVALHAVVALLLVWKRRDARLANAPDR